MTRQQTPGEALLLLGPPYDHFTNVDPADPVQPGAGGWIVIWRLGGEDWEGARDFVVNRAAGVSLAVVLPEHRSPPSFVPLLRVIGQSRPQAVLPFHETPRPSEIASAIRRPPVNLASSVIEYMEWRSFSMDPVTRDIIRRTLELSARIRTVSELARNLYTSRRALGRRFLSRKLPVPSHWLHIARILRATIKLQNSNATVFNVASSLGYPDGFSLSNQMRRLCGLRPQEVRELAGWEWVLESWIQAEAEMGNITPAIAGARPSVAIRATRGGEDRARPDQAASGS